MYGNLFVARAVYNHRTGALYSHLPQRVLLLFQCKVDEHQADLELANINHVFDAQLDCAQHTELNGPLV